MADSARPALPTTCQTSGIVLIEMFEPFHATPCQNLTIAIQRQSVIRCNEGLLEGARLWVGKSQDASRGATSPTVTDESFGQGTQAGTRSLRYGGWLLQGLCPRCRGRGGE